MSYLHLYKKAKDRDVEKSLAEQLNLTEYQIQEMKDNEIVRFFDFEFFEPRKKITNIFYRFSIILYPFTYLFLFIGLPIKFIFTGKWGYNRKVMNYFDQWKTNIGL